MQLLNIDSFIVLGYLLLTLIVGIYKGRNIKNIKEYAVGDYTFSTTTLVATITATFLGGGSMIGVTEKVYSHGIGWIIIFLGDTLTILLFYLIAPKVFDRFHGCISVGEILGNWYGKPARIIGGFCSVCLIMGGVSVQIIALGHLYSDFMSVPLIIGLIIAAGTVIVYSAFGGIKAVTYTDVIQFAFFIIVVPLGWRI